MAGDKYNLLLSSSFVIIITDLIFDMDRCISIMRVEQGTMRWVYS